MSEEKIGKKPSRRKDRARAFQVLYGLSHVDPSMQDGLETAFAKCPHQDENAPEAPAQGFAWELVSGVWNAREELDATIERHSRNWKVSRIGRIELTVLRLALYEMLHRTDVPVKVAINEGVELAKQFGDDNSPGFINGILDAAARALERGDKGKDR